MVKHIVMWELNAEAKKDINNIASDLQKRFKSLLGVVDGLKAIEVSKNYNGGKFDIVLFCDFDTKDAQDKYQTHPAHLAIKEVVHELTCDRDCVDCEI